MEIDKMNANKIRANNNNNNNNVQRESSINTQSKCYAEPPRPRKRLEPIDEVIEPKRQKLFQVETSIRNLSNV